MRALLTDGDWNLYQALKNACPFLFKMPVLSFFFFLSLPFKWVDNPQAPGDIMDFYLSGDVAPEGRFLYRYAAD